MTDQLRGALGADADTPAGVDLGAVRDRARSLRRRRTTALAGAAAVLTAAAIVVPAGLLGGGGSGPDTGPVAAPAGTTATSGALALACPPAPPAKPANSGAGLADALVPFPADDALVCVYDDLAPAAGSKQPGGVGPGRVAAGGLSGVLRLSPADARTTADRLNSGATSPPLYCTADIGVPIVMVAGGQGRTVELRLEPYGCGTMTNGTSTRSGLTQQLRDLRSKAEATTECPTRQPDPEPRTRAATGTPLLPVETRRLLLCAYGTDGRRLHQDRWAGRTDDETTRSLVGRINASPEQQGVPGCVEDRSPRLVVYAVAPGGVTRVFAISGACRTIGNSSRWVVAKGPIDQLIKLVRQR